MRVELTKPQREMLELLADGKHYQDLAVLTGVSYCGMKARGKRLMEVMHAETLAHAVAIGFREGFLR